LANYNGTRNRVGRHGIPHSKHSHIFDHGNKVELSSHLHRPGHFILETDHLSYNYVIMYFIAAGEAILHYHPCINARGTLRQNIKTIIRKAVGTKNRKA